MSTNRYVERAAGLTGEQRLLLYEALAHNLAVAIRGVLSDESATAQEKVERMKWVNEILHSATAKVWVLRLETHEGAEEDFGSLVARCVAQQPAIAGDVAAAIDWSFAAVT